ncbi:MAG TPA: PASTA domain-containing protein [Solirubrobacterales bacterium]
MQATGTIVLVSLLALGVWASTASAEPLSMTFTEDRANVGVQLSDEPMFTAPDTAPLTAQIDPGTGSITAGVLEVPDFFTHITEPLDADVLVHFEIGIIEGSFNQATGALTLEGEANATLTSEGKECTVTTTPNPLVLSTAGNSGGSNPRSGAPFVNGLTGAGTIAGQWTDMDATPKIPGDGVFVCATVDERIEGPGGIWLAQEGDVVPPSAPQLTSTNPASPGSSGTPRVLGAAEAGSTVRVYAGPNCTGTPVATGSAAKLGSPGIPVEVAEGVTAAFSATATDAADNTSACSAPISYTRLKVPTPTCVVPKLAGKKLKAAKREIKAAGCKVGKVTKPKARKGKKRGPLVVKSSKPSAGTILNVGSEVNLKLGPKPRKAPR